VISRAIKAVRVQQVFTMNGCRRLLRGGVERVPETKPFSLLIAGTSKQSYYIKE